MKFSNITLWVQENKLSEKFYKKLGFVVTKSDDTHSIVELDNLQIVLVSIRDEPPFERDAMSGDRGRGVYLYLRVDDVDALHQQLIQTGLQPATTPRDWPWGNREFIVKDPDGYKLCFWQPL